MMVDPAEFRWILGHWATGVAIVTTVTNAGEPRGLTASAVASVSLVPPLVLVCVDRAADSWQALRDSAVFAINVLGDESELTARRFAADDIADKFRGIAYGPRISGAPVLAEALAWIDCRVHAIHDGGDHDIFIGAVLAGAAREGAPLLYYRSGYGRLTP